MAKQEEDLTDVIFAGADPYEDDPITPAARGDMAESVAPESEPASETEPAEAEPEPEAEPEAPAPEPEAEPEPEPEAPKPKAKGDEPKIPKSRFDEVNERRKEAERALAEYKRREQEAKDKAEKPAAPEFDFDAAEDRYQDALLDGDKNLAKEIRREIRTHEQALYEARAAEIAPKVTKAEATRQAVEARANAFAEQYPVFDAQSEQFDEAMTGEVMAMYRGYMAAGEDPVKALERATTNVVRLYDLEAPATEAEPEAAAPQQKASPAQVKSKLERATQQPPAPASREMAPRPDLSRMSEADFEKLSDMEVKKLRGDMV